MSRQLVILLAASMLGCVPGFAAVYPGMTGTQVVQAMGRGPTRTQQFDADYTAWYYGEDRCVLMRENQVVDKQQTRTTQSAAFFVGAVEQRQLAECVPPGLPRQNKSVQQVDTVFGSVRVEDPPPAPAPPPPEQSPAEQPPPPANGP